MREHPYITLILGIAAIRGIVSVLKGPEPPMSPEEARALSNLGLGISSLGSQADHPGAHPPASFYPSAPPAPQASPYAAPPGFGPHHLVGFAPPGMDYSFSRRPGFNDKNF